MSKFSIDDAAGDPNHNTSRATIKSDDASNGSGGVRDSGTPESPIANGPQVAPSGTKRRANKIATDEPKKGQTGFSVHEDDWAHSIPKPGHYPATVVNASINPRSEVVYLNIEYAILGDDGRRIIVTDFLVLDAPRQDRQYTRSAEGKGRVKAIMVANNRPLQFSSIQAVPVALIGCRAIIAVGHRYLEGIPIPKVQGIVGPAEPEQKEP